MYQSGPGASVTPTAQLCVCLRVMGATKEGHRGSRLKQQQEEEEKKEEGGGGYCP